MEVVKVLAWAWLANMANRPPPTPAKKELMQKAIPLVLGQVDAHGLGGHLILPDGLEGPAIGGVDQQHHDPDAHCHQQEGHKGGKAQHHLPIGVLDVEAGEGGKALQRVGAVGDRAQPVPLEDGPDDLRKAQGGDGQVVALQPQHRQADKPGDHRRHTARQDQRRQHTQDRTPRAPPPNSSGREKFTAEPP